MKAGPAPAPCDDSLPPARVYLQEVPQPSRAALPAEGPSVEACRGPGVGAGISYSSRDREEAGSARVSAAQETAGDHRRWAGRPLSPRGSDQPGQHSRTSSPNQVLNGNTF